MNCIYLFYHIYFGIKDFFHMFGINGYGIIKKEMWRKFKYSFTDKEKV